MVRLVPTMRTVVKKTEKLATNSDTAHLQFLGQTIRIGGGIRRRSTLPDDLIKNRAGRLQSQCPRRDEHEENHNLDRAS